MPISKPSTWETGFKNSPQAETTQLRDMGLYLNSKGEFETLDTTWCNVLSKTPTQFYTAASGWKSEGIFLTPKGIGIGINPMRPDIDFLATYGVIVFKDLNIFDPGQNLATLTLGDYNNSDSGKGTRAEVAYDWDASTYNSMNIYAFDYDSGASNKYDAVIFDGNPLFLNTANASYVQIFDSTGGNVGIGGGSFGSSANFNLALYNGTAPGSNIGGVSLYAESGAAKVRGGSGTITTFGAADPHCQRCYRYFALEWENEKYGKLAICAWCLSEKFDDIVIEKYEGGN